MEFVPKLNLLFAWVWILAGFVSGMVMGTQFHREQWLGGYGSHKRRLFRLGHISFFGLGLMNFLFYFTATSLGGTGNLWAWASVAFVVGGITMPICCAIMAYQRNWTMIFSVPVASLIAAAVLTIINIGSL